MSNKPDEVDVISQRDLVKNACENIGYQVVCLTVGDNLKADLELVKNEKADIIFNLVEATWGIGELCYFAPAIINSYKIAYTGVPLDALFVTTNKVLAKKILRFNNLPTADFFSINELEKLNKYKTYIAKPIWEEASVGITTDFIFNISETDKFDLIKQLPNSHYFVEEFIEGREFNVSILAAEKTAEILSPAEMIFSEYFDDKPKIVGYKAKWDEESEEFKHTNRAFGTLDNNPELKKNIENICRKTWKAFNLKGYARIDLRLDNEENIFILEINGNPCIAADSGFVAAVKYSNYTLEMMIERILNDLN